MDKTEDPVWITKTIVINLTKIPKTYTGKKTASLTNSSRKSGCLYGKEWHWPISITLYKNQMIKHLNMKPLMFTLIEENKGSIT